MSSREELEDRLARLQDLERWNKEGADNRERMRADAVRVAIEHLQTAMARSSRSVRSRTLMLYGQLGNRGENRTVSQ